MEAERLLYRDEIEVEFQFHFHSLYFPVTLNSCLGFEKIDFQN